MSHALKMRVDLSHSRVGINPQWDGSSVITAIWLNETKQERSSPINDYLVEYGHTWVNTVPAKLSVDIVRLVIFALAAPRMLKVVVPPGGVN